MFDYLGLSLPFPFHFGKAANLMGQLPAEYLLKYAGFQSCTHVCTLCELLVPHEVSYQKGTMQCGCPACVQILYIQSPKPAGSHS